MKKCLISSAYIYPICPLSTNHARMFLFGDIIARYARMKWKSVFFPVASHLSGNTAHKIANIFKKYFFNNTDISREEENIISLYKNIYKLQNYILRSFIDPINILNFYNRETLWELQSLWVSGDYENAYTTWHEDFWIFINTLVEWYEKNHLITRNSKGELALNYDDKNWIAKLLQRIEKTEFTQSFHRNNIKSAVRDIRNDWGILREDGFGVTYKGKWVIDPMFDSELFTLFDLYIRSKKELWNIDIPPKDIFENLFWVLKNWEQPKSTLVEKILSWLPCDVCICEEHLKNWIVKKIYAETFIMKEDFQTLSYFVLWMGSLNGKRMSASRWTAILANDLIHTYWPIKARLIMLLWGGHPSKNYSYEPDSPEQAEKLLTTFTRYFTYITAISLGEITQNNNQTNVEMNDIDQIEKLLEDHIDNWYYRQAITELMSIIPKKFSSLNSQLAREVIRIYEKYMPIFLPTILNGFNH